MSGTIYIFESGVALLKFHNCFLNGNIATSGAVVICTNCQQIDIINTTFKHNTAINSGGLLYLKYDKSFNQDSYLLMYNSRCIYNMAGNEGSVLFMFYHPEGALYEYAWQRKPLWIANVTYHRCVFEYNKARKGQYFLVMLLIYRILSSYSFVQS